MDTDICHRGAMGVYQECESTLKSLRKTEQDLGGRAEEGMRVSEETDERLAALEAEIDALRLREQELPQQVRGSIAYRLV